MWLGACAQRGVLMTPTDRQRSPVRLTLFCSLLLIPLTVVAQTPAPPPPAATASAQAPDPVQQKFFDTVTVSATLTPTAIKEVPGTVTVIDFEAIARRMAESAVDLVKYEPGVYVESNLAGTGANGFNIRGIGGNRVLTQVDGVETAEQFDFGPFNVHQFQVDLDTLKSAEIVRSAASALYGSDALGGVVSFFTKDPADYLQGRTFHAAARTVYDGRSDTGSGNFVVAGGNRRLQTSLFASVGRGQQPRNKGTVETQDARRTVLNPQDRRTVQALGKAVFRFSDSNVLRGVFEIADSEIETQAFTARTAAATDVASTDTMQRRRVSVDHTLVNRAGLNLWQWSAYVQNSDTDQVVDEVRPAAGPTPAVNRRGTLDYTQESYGAALQGRKLASVGGQGVLVTFGGSYKHNTFDMIRDRIDTNALTGATVPATNLILPTKYFPKSDVGEFGSYVQGELRVGSRLTILPGVRYDRYSMDADAGDRVFLASLSPAPVDFDADAVSAKFGGSYRVSNVVTVHAQYAGGFRAPPYSAINSGFTNLLAGYTSVPNTELDPETSDNFEGGVRSTVGRVSVGVTAFSNHYDNFILQAQRGVNPSTGLLEFQYQNLAKVRIAGVELQADARVSNAVRVRASYAVIRGDDVSGQTDVPLETIAPDQGVIGIEFAPSKRWGSELTVRAVRGKSSETLAPGLFGPSAFGVVDIYGWVTLTRTVTLRAGVLNLTDATYFEWANVRGRLATDATIDRYSSPGMSGIVSLAYGW
jgi:hemoglobin/transferrin/lactoferrin receptor protein